MTERRATHLRIKAQIFRGQQIAIGPGKAALLEAVEQSGSIAAAGRRLGISYRRTRDMIDTLNQCWGCPVVATEKGGKSGGGSRLTLRGRAVLGAYRALEEALRATADQHGPALLDLLEPPLIRPRQTRPINLRRGVCSTQGSVTDGVLIAVGAGPHVVLACKVRWHHQVAAR